MPHAPSTGQYPGTARRPEERRDEEQSDRSVGRRDRRRLSGLEVSVRIEHEHGRDVEDLLENGGDHDDAIARRIGGDDEERELPYQGHTDETVVQIGVRDWWRVSAADGVEREEQGRHDQDAPDAGYPEHDAGEPIGTNACTLLKRRSMRNGDAGHAVLQQSARSGRPSTCRAPALSLYKLVAGLKYSNVDNPVLKGNTVPCSGPQGNSSFESPSN